MADAPPVIALDFRISRYDLAESIKRTNDLRRHSRRNTVRRQRRRHEAHRADDRIVADLDSFKNHYAASQPDIVADHHARTGPGAAITSRRINLVKVAIDDRHGIADLAAASDGHFLICDDGHVVAEQIFVADPDRGLTTPWLDQDLAVSMSHRVAIAKHVPVADAQTSPSASPDWDLSAVGGSGIEMGHFG